MSPSGVLTGFFRPKAARAYLYICGFERLRARFSALILVRDQEVECSNHFTPIHKFFGNLELWLLRFWVAPSMSPWMSPALVTVRQRTSAVCSAVRPT